MAPSFDYEASSLLCAEEDTSIFEDDVDSYDVQGQGQGQHSNYDEIYNLQQYTTITTTATSSFNNLFNQDDNFNGGGMGMGMGMQIQSDECLVSMFDKETHYFPALNYLKRLRIGDLDLGARNEAVDWIQKVQSHYNFGPLCHYLSINYLDRFLSVYELPKGKSWMMQLLAVACLSLAAKLEETQVPFLLDLQVGEAKSVFEAKTIQRMELLVLTTLKWRMQSVTPFTFIDYFLYKLNKDQTPPKTSILQSIQLILTTIKGIDLLEFRASEIAAAVAISVTQQTPLYYDNPDNQFSFLYHHIHKEKLIKCLEVINDLTNTSRCKQGSGLSSTSVPHSPNGVLDVACLSFQSDDISTPSTSCANSPAAPSPKRRKLHTSI